MGEDMSQTKRYLEQMVGMMRKIRESGAPYNSLEDFVLRNGRTFPEKGPMPKGHRRGRMKLCYMNALHLAERTGMIYVEGYALGHILPVHHAWCIDEKGRVVDPTWKDFGTDYFGVPLKIEYVIRTALRRRAYGVMDNYEEGWPLLMGLHTDFLDERGMKHDPHTDA